MVTENCSIGCVKIGLYFHFRAAQYQWTVKTQKEEVCALSNHAVGMFHVTKIMIASSMVRCFCLFDYLLI